LDSSGSGQGQMTDLAAQQWTFRFHKRRRISWLDERLLVSLEGLRSMEFVYWLVWGDIYYCVRKQLLIMFRYN